MSFLNIKDSFKRDKTVKEYLALKKRIKNRNLQEKAQIFANHEILDCLLYTSPSPRDRTRSRMPSSA